MSTAWVFGKETLVKDFSVGGSVCVWGLIVGKVDVYVLMSLFVIVPLFVRVPLFVTVPLLCVYVIV